MDTNGHEFQALTLRMKETPGSLFLFVSIRVHSWF